MISAIEHPVRCNNCGPFLITNLQHEEQRSVLRYCPICGQRILYWDKKAKEEIQTQNDTRPNQQS